MNLKIILPTQIFLDQPVKKIIGQAPNGSFCLLPRHIDFVSLLSAGLLYYEPVEGDGEYLALGHGTLVKCGQEVRVATRHAVGGADIGHLKQQVEQHFRVQDDQEKQSRAALARLEIDFIRRFMDLGK